MMRTLDLREAAVHGSKQPQILFGSANLDHNYRPFRGLLFSLLIHAFLLCGMLFFPISDKVSERSRYLARAVIIDRNKIVLYLPPLGGKPHQREPESGSKPYDKSAPVASPRRTQGLSYPGPQPIVSDFEQPTTPIQTVLQLALPNPTILRPVLLLPNIVRLADADPALEDKSPDPILKPADAAALAVKVAPPLPLEPPEKAQLSAIPETKSPKPSERPPEPPKPVEQFKVDPPAVNSPVPVKGPDLRNFLALTPMPSVSEPALSAPPGEARGRFAISPDPNLLASGTEPGSKGTTAAAPGTPATASDGVSRGPAKTERTSGTGTNAARGSAAGPGLASGSGTSSGPDKNVFPGITIIGGAVDIRTAGNPASNVRTSPLLETSYGITVLSAGAGGGLPNFGVFSNEQVYTAFIDMKRNTSDQAPSWTVEYALLQGIPGQTSGASKPGGGQLGIVLPFPAVKDQPAMPPELVSRYARRMVIVYAIVNIEGKMEQMVVKDSPDDRLNEPVLKALSKWILRPAQRDGETVPAKALLGIPVWAPLVP
jgi:hypothetical protein